MKARQNLKIRLNDNHIAMTAYLIRLRFLQLYRGSGDLGLFRVLLLVVVLFPLLTLFLVQRISYNPYSIAIPAASLYIIWMVHGKRKDYHFLTANLLHPKTLFLSEYSLLMLPVAALLLSAALYIHVLVFYTIIILIALSVPTPEMKLSLTAKLRFIPSGMFEWQSGVRKNLFVLVLFYIPGLLGFYQVWLSAASLLLLTMVFVSFYSEYEPGNMILACDCGPWRFLARKVARHAGCFALFLLPLFIIALTHDDYRLIAAGYFLASLNLLIFSVLLKYYQYRPRAYSGAHQLLTTLACLISVILPVTLIIAGFNIFLAAGAHKNLKRYLDDRN